LECDKNHIHVLFCYPPNLALSEIARHLKGFKPRPQSG
jgi:REP element-mobilizing transposase RayT